MALTDLPDELARKTLMRWIDADAGDVDARVALLRRMGADPRADDPQRESRLTQLRELLATHPGHADAREVLVTALADAGEMEEGGRLLETWPMDQRDSRYWRLQGRWYLEHDHRPDQAIAALRTALVDFPHDWRVHYRLARRSRSSTAPTRHTARQRRSAGFASCLTRSRSGRSSAPHSLTWTNPPPRKPWRRSATAWG